MHKTRLLSVFSAGLFWLALIVCGCAPAAETASADTIRVNVAIESAAIRVDIALPAIAHDSLIWSVSRWAGVDDFAADFDSMTATDPTGKILEPMQSGNGRWVLASAHQPVRLAYRVHNQRTSFMGDSRTDQFHVALFGDWMFAWGYGWLVEFEDSLVNRLPVSVTIASPHYGDISSNRDLSSPLDSLAALSESILAAGTYASAAATIRGTTVHFLVQDAAWSFTPQEFFAAVDRILTTQADLFGFYPTDRLLIVLNEGQSGSTGGSVIENAIALSADPALPLTGDGIKTLQLIAHENMHVWNGNHVRHEESRPEGYYKWFTEGFTDYYSWLTLYRAGELTDSAFIAALNTLLLEYQINPYATTATNDTLAEKYWENNEYRTLPYRKGALIALLIDVTMRHQTGAAGLDSVMRLLMADTTAQRTGFDTDQIQRLIEDITASPWDEFFTRYVSGADPLPISALLPAAGITTGMETTTVFELGIESEPIPDARARLIRSVTPASNAELAGVHAGDTLTGWSYMGGRAEEPARLTVQRDGASQDISYLPAATRAIVQIDFAPDNRAAIRRLLWD